MSEDSEINSSNMFKKSTTRQTVLNSSISESPNVTNAQSVVLEAMVAKFSKIIEPMFVILTNEMTSLRQEISGLRNEAKELNVEKSSLKLVSPESPFKKMDDFLKFEKQLQEDQNFLDSFQKELLTVSKTTNFTRNCWRRLLEDEVAENLCWKGTVDKKSVRSLSTAKAIRNAAISIGLDEEEYIKSTKSFFQFAKYRQESRNKYKPKPKNNT